MLWFLALVFCDVAKPRLQAKANFSPAGIWLANIKLGLRQFSIYTVTIVRYQVHVQTQMKNKKTMAYSWSR